jgi:hypothetical protein
MGRAIVTSPSRRTIQDAFPGLASDSHSAMAPTLAKEDKPDTFRDRLFKYIPAEVVTLYLALNAIVAANKDAPHFLYWCVFFFGLICTPLYLWRVQNVTASTQLIVSTIAFAVWVVALGEPFTSIVGYRQVYGELLLPVFTVLVAFISPRPT